MRFLLTLLERLLDVLESWSPPVEVTPEFPQPPAGLDKPLADMLEYHNQARLEAGKDPLKFHMRLRDAALEHGEWMAKNNRFSHTGKNGSSVADRVRDAGYSYSYVGENIYKGTTPPSHAFQAWMNSNGHRANILNGNYTDIGLHYTSSTDGVMYWTAVFGRPSRSVSSLWTRFKALV